VKQKEEEGVSRERNLIKENASLYYVDARDIFSVDYASEFTLLNSQYSKLNKCQLYDIDTS